MARDDPHHPQGVHHGWYGVQHDGKVGPMGNVLEVTLQGPEELDIVLCLRVVLCELAALILKVGEGGNAGDFENGQGGLHHRLLELLVQRAKQGVALLPKVNLGKGAVPLGLLFQHLLHGPRHDFGPALHVGFQLEHQGRALGPHSGVFGEGDDGRGELELDLSLHLVNDGLHLGRELLHVDEQFVSHHGLHALVHGRLALWERLGFGSTRRERGRPELPPTIPTPLAGGHQEGHVDVGEGTLQVLEREPVGGARFEALGKGGVCI